MTVHNNIHIPNESFPTWIWSIIEFFIVFAVSLLLSKVISPQFQNIFDASLINWIFWCITSISLIMWYFVIRRFLLHKPILNKN